MNLRGVRDARWKLVVGVRNGVVRGRELYDLGHDVSEKFDRIKDHPEIAKKLAAKAQQFYDEISRNVRPIGKVE